MEKRIIQKGAVDDLVLLDALTEDAIMDNFKATFKQDRIYTYIGPVLISMNPFKQIHGLYAPALLRKYTGRYMWELAPHVYAVAEDAYRAMLSNHQDQAILVSGESGAGKTEAAKKIMEYIAAVSGDKSARGGDVNIKDRLLQSNPVLEAFGNAKTCRNDNSSRFGKYMQILFDYSGVPLGSGLGGRVTNYLLEKPRVVAPAKDERSFHVFYQLLAGASAEERSGCHLAPATSFQSLARSGCVTVPGTSDKDEYRAMRDAMNGTAFATPTQAAIVRLASLLVAAVLWVGNVAFGPGGTGGACKVTDPGQALAYAAGLLGVAPAALEGALTHRTIATQGGLEKIRTPLQTVEECAETAQAFAKYARLFQSLVTSINAAIAPAAGKWLTMGVLDIYGFEIFEVNSFEQLCINYCNEKLQQLFIELTLKSEQEEYVAEGIPWTPVDYFNNKTVCDLIEGKKPAGIIAYLDEESLMPKGTAGTDASLHDKMCGALKANKHFSASGVSKAGGLFTIKHYAGDVVYTNKHLLEKNKDQLFRDLIELSGGSSVPLVAELFPEAKEKATTQKRPVTAGSQFRTQINDLVGTLTQCQPHYIRCIKPNDAKRSGLLDAPRVLDQVRYLGLLENVRVRRAGYAFRQTFERFAARYKLLCNATWPLGSGDARQDVGAIMSEVGVSADQYKFGKTKIFVEKPLTLFTLEEMRERKLHDIARILQAGYRSYRARKYFLALREKSLGIFHGRKRRRGSWALYFLGDYIHAGESMEVAKLMAKTADQRVLFADIAIKVNRNRKSQERALLLTERALYTLTPGKWKVTNRVPLERITGLSMSTFADGYFVLHVDPDCPGMGGADLVLHSIRKSEITTVLSEEMDLAGRELSLHFDDRIAYRSKGPGLRSSGIETRHLEFAEDSALGGAKTAAHVLDDKAADPSAMKVRLSAAYGSGAALQLTADLPHRAKHAAAAVGRQRNDSVTKRGYGHSAGDKRGGAAPPPPQRGGAHGKSFSTFPRARAMFEYTPTSPQELALTVGQTVKVVEKFGDGWWNAEYNGKTGLVPANYMELL